MVSLRVLFFLLISVSCYSQKLIQLQLNGISGNNFWRTTGNANTDTSNFLGTTDAQDLVIKTNNTEAMRVLSSGNLMLSSVPQGAVTDSLLTWSNTDSIVRKVPQRGYKVYTALLTQTGTNAPTATVLENTLGGTVVWTRDSQGIYFGTLAGVFTLNKTVSIISPTGTGFYFAYAGIGDANIIYVETQDQSAVADDDRLTSTSIEIRVYP